MRRRPARQLSGGLFFGLVATVFPLAAVAQGPYDTTLITHGATFSPTDPTEWCGGTCEPADPSFPCLPVATDCPTLDFSSTTCVPAPVSDWLITMAMAVLQRADPSDTCDGSGGTVLVYAPCTGVWETDCGSEDPGAPIVLVFNWGRESDGLNEGGPYGYAEAAGDALYAALRDPVLPGDLAGLDLLSDRSIHFIGHSRGTVVNSEAAERLSKANLRIEHITMLDPHPVDGTPPPDWGDPQPRIWNRVERADDYWRDDFEPLDFNGQPIAGSTDLNLECGVEETESPGDHSKAHAWYHGTIDLTAMDDGASTPIPIEDDYYDVPNMAKSCAAFPDGDPIPPRDATGYNVAPNPVARVAPSYSPSRIYNGDFEVVDPVLLHVGHAGWRYHGGTQDGILTPWGTETGNHYLRLTPAIPSMRHNRLFIDERASALRFRYRRFGAAGAGDELRMALLEVTTGTPAATVLDTIAVSSMPTSFVQASFAVAGADRGRSWGLRVEVFDTGGAVTSTVDVDDLEFDTAPFPFEIPTLPSAALLTAAAAILAVGFAARRGPRRSHV